MCPQLHRIAEQHPELIPIFVTYCRSLVYDSRIWQLSHQVQWEVYQTLKSLSLSELEWSDVWLLCVLPQHPLPLKKLLAMPSHS